MHTTMSKTEYHFQCWHGWSCWSPFPIRVGVFSWQPNVPGLVCQDLQQIGHWRWTACSELTRSNPANSSLDLDVGLCVSTMIRTICKKLTKWCRDPNKRKLWLYGFVKNCGVAQLRIFVSRKREDSLWISSPHSRDKQMILSLTDCWTKLPSSSTA